MNTERPATTLLCATLVGVFALQALFGATSGIGLARMGATTPWFWTEGQFWTLLSSSLLHIGLLHLLANLYFTWFIGGALEEGIGGARMLIVFFVGGITGSTASVVFLGEAVSAGASGGAWGLMLAILVLLLVPRLRIDTRVQGGSVKPVLQMIGLNALISFFPGVNGLAHFGGGIGGALALVVLQTLPIPLKPTAALLYIAHLAALGWAIVDGHPWAPFRTGPMVDQIVGDGALVIRGPADAPYDTVPKGGELRSPPLHGFVGGAWLHLEPLPVDVAFDGLLEPVAGGEVHELRCPETCRAALVDLGDRQYYTALRSYELIATQTLLIGGAGTSDWMAEAVIATRLGPVGVTKLIEAAGRVAEAGDPELARAALNAGLADHPTDPALLAALSRLP